MTIPLDVVGRPVSIEGVEIVSPGLHGEVAVLSPGTPGLRGTDAARDVLVAALGESGLQEQRTIVISGHHVDRVALGGPVTRSTRHGEPALSVTVPGPGEGMGQVLLAADEVGIMHWVFPDDDAPATARMRGGVRRRYTIPIDIAEAPTDSGQRGLLGAIGKKVLKVFAFKLLDRVAGDAANRFAAKLEATAHPHRLRRFGPDNYRLGGVDGLTAADLAPYSGQPTLLFIHGTMSLSHSGFGRLPLDVLTRLDERYGRRVLAFDHPTVSVTPTVNARWLADLTRDAGLQVDIVAHSRGGLVSRVLTERPGDVGLAAGSLAIRQLVMIGTPNQGTALANDDRLGDLVDRLTNLLELIPDNGFTDVLNVIISVVKQLAVGAFGGLEGIAAMKPGGPWLTDMNRVRPLSAVYRAIASNYEPPAGAPLARVASDRVADLVFAGLGNDLIVPATGVYAPNGADGFPVPDPLTFAAAQSVDHSSYWVSPAVHKAFDQWLVP